MAKSYSCLIELFRHPIRDNNFEMIREPEFFKWIKIRIGEPLTAVDMNESNPIITQESSSSDPFPATSGSTGSITTRSNISKAPSNRSYEQYASSNPATPQRKQSVRSYWRQRGPLAGLRYIQIRAQEDLKKPQQHNLLLLDVLLEQREGGHILRLSHTEERHSPYFKTYSEN